LEGGILAAVHVSEGQVVRRDQILATIRNTKAIDDLRAGEADIAHLAARIARLRAESSGEVPVFGEELMTQWPQIVETQEIEYAANKRELEASLQSLSDQVRQRQQELVEAQSKIDQLQGSETLAREEMSILRPLVEQGLKARIELVRLERQVNDISGELATTRSSVPRIRAAVNEVRGRISERRAAWEAEVAGQLSEAQANLSAITSEVSTAADRVERTELRSPVEGKIQQILINTIGGVIQPGQDLIEVVPIEDNLLVEAQIRPSDIGFLSPGQAAIVKLTAYDFAIYGGLERVVTNRIQDSQEC
jgi:adhesin transport system membrane fusion protein